MQRGPRFSHPSTEELFAYWNRRRGHRSAPDRAEIEPGDIRTLLPDTFILEVDPGRGFAWRLAGTRVSALHCRELKGRDFLGDWQGRERETLQSLLDAVVRESAVAIVQSEARTERDHTLAMELVFLPLKVFGRSTCRVLGAIGTHDMPYWLGLYPPIDRRVTGLRMVWPSPSEPAKPDVFAVPPAMPAPPPENGRRYRHLMVVDGGKR